ncbi:MAG TPA: hypothetical protein VHD56_07730 [Tepidisphaeraceae bacterium]|nr:hypothetical protein [Tepidisphaeraceae bacterium]
MSLRYVISRHEGVEEPHYDLMFETAPGSQLSTWRSPSWPILERTRLTKLRDHRRMYLDYEGPIPGDRGHVLRIGAGTCTVQTDAGDSYRFVLDNRLLLVIQPVHDEIWEAKSTEKTGA